MDRRLFDSHDTQSIPKYMALPVALYGDWKRDATERGSAHLDRSGQI